MYFDRRAIFFLCAAVVCGLLIPLTPPKFQWVGRDVTIVYAVLALLSFLDHVSRARFKPKKQ